MILTEVFFFKFTSNTDPDTKFVGTLKERDFSLFLIFGITSSAALTAEVDFGIRFCTADRPKAYCEKVSPGTDQDADLPSSKF